MDTNQNLKLSFYGFGIEIKSTDPEALQNIKRDYSFFEDKNCKTKVSLEIFPTAPSYKDLPSLTASLYTPRNICYTHKNITYIDYFGRGLAIIDSQINSYKIYSSDSHLRHEISYLTIMSLVGQNLDSRGMHRVHGFGIDLNGRGVLALLPRGGGKTTLLLELLKENNIRLISEDSPLIDKKGNILPFPIRIGVSSEEKPQGIPEEYISFVKRMEFEPKYLIDINAFKNKISKNPSRPWIILVGVRSLGGESKIIPFSKFKTLQEFVKNSVVGLGLYQGVEFILQASILELFGKMGVVFSRLRNALRVIFKSRAYLFIIGCDKKNSLATLINFLNNIY